jgi:hypothetical protein
MLAASAALWGHGYHTGRSHEIAAQARLQLAAEATAADRRATINSIEAGRLADQAGIGFTLGEIKEETIADPDAGAVSLGVRDIQRLNRLR